jgi:CubicO group peptidase (beta-lactamase class C family)
LADEEPWWEPGSGHGYHVNTLGFLAGELVRRVSGTPFGTFFTMEVAGPLGAEVRFGLRDKDLGRAATFLFPEGAGEPAPFTASAADWVYRNPAGISGLGTVNSTPWRQAVHPSTNAHATACGIATVYAALANGGSLGRVELFPPSTLQGACTERSVGHDLVLDRPTRFGAGFQLTQPERMLGPGPNGFGHFGAGGSLGMADPDVPLALAYVMNRFGHRWQDPRNQTLLMAAYDAV